LINFFSKLEREVIYCINSIQYRKRPYEINILYEYLKKISVEHFKFFSCVEKYVININLTKYYVEELIFHLLLIQYIKKKIRMQSELKISFNKYIKFKQYSMNKEKEKMISLTLNLDFYYIIKNISFEYIKLTKYMYLKVKKTLNKILLFDENFDIYSKFITNFKRCFNHVEKNFLINKKYYIKGGIYEIENNIFSNKIIKVSAFSYLKINKNITQFQEGLNKNEKNIFSKILFNPYDKCLYIQNDLVLLSRPKYSFLLFHYHCVVNKKIKILYLTENLELRCNCEVYYYFFNFFFYGFYIKNDEQKEIKYMYELFELIFETNFFPNNYLLYICNICGKINYYMKD